MVTQQPVEITLDQAFNEMDKYQTSFARLWSYYNAQARDMAIGIATPPQLRKLLAQVGIPRIYVSAIAERLILEGFQRGDSTPSGDDELWAWYRANSLDSQMVNQVTDSLVYGRSYITISAPTEEDEANPLRVPDIPVIKVESPRGLFAKIDPRTGEVLWAVRKVLDDSNQVASATLYFPDRTEYYLRDQGQLKVAETVQHGLGVVPVVPVVRRSNSADLYGTSIITEEIQSVTDAASRILMNMQATSELMATPQRVIFGASANEIKGDTKSPLELYINSYIAIEDPQGKVAQLNAAELRNFTEAIDQLLRMAAVYTGLPPSYLSSSSDNPASAEAIRAAETRLVRTCESLTVQFGDAWERAMRVALLVMGRQLSLDDFRMEALWRDPSTPTVAAIADATAKKYANGAGFITKEQARIDAGYSPEQRRRMEAEDKTDPINALNAMYEQPVSDEPS